MTGAFRFLLLSVLVMGCHAKKESAKESAQEAFYGLKANVFNADSIQVASDKINAAEKSDPGEPWVYMAKSELALVQGYILNSWYDSADFRPGVVQEAFESAWQAYSLDSASSYTNAQLGMMYIVKEDRETAFRYLRKSYDADPSNFYPYFLLGIIYEKSANPDRAIPHFEQAEKFASRHFQKQAVWSNLAEVYGLINKPEEEEKLLLRLIEDEPANAYHHEGYGVFLQGRHRLDEAIAEYKKAVGIKPYPNVVRLLDEAVRKKDSLSRHSI